MPEEKVGQRLDLRGEVCPYPTAKTSVILKKRLQLKCWRSPLNSIRPDRQFQTLWENWGIRVACRLRKARFPVLHP